LHRLADVSDYQVRNHHFHLSLNLYRRDIGGTFSVIGTSRISTHCTVLVVLDFFSAGDFSDGEKIKALEYNTLDGVLLGFWRIGATQLPDRITKLSWMTYWVFSMQSMHWTSMFSRRPGSTNYPSLGQK